MFTYQAKSIKNDFIWDLLDIQLEPKEMIFYVTITFSKHLKNILLYQTIIEYYSPESLE